MARKELVQSDTEQVALVCDQPTASPLQKAVLAYLRECDNPVPDYGYRRTLRNRLRELTGAPAEMKR